MRPAPRFAGSTAYQRHPEVGPSTWLLVAVKRRRRAVTDGFPRSLPFAPARESERTGDRVRVRMPLADKTPPGTVAAAILPVLRKSAGQHGFKTKLWEQATVAVPMPA